MCKHGTTVDETTPETSPDDAVAESQPEEGKDCVENALSAEAEETNEQQLLLPISTHDVDETEPEMDSSDESNLPEEENLIAPDDEPVELEQNTLNEMNKTLSGVWELLQDSLLQNQDQTKMFEMIQTLPTTLSELKELFEKQISGNQNQINMFDTMYREMEGYKENFLLVGIHKPIIHELIQLYDDFKLLESQFKDILSKNDFVSSEGLPEQLEQFQKNMKNVQSELEETLYRMDVTLYEEQHETLNRKLHKTIDTISTDDPDKDQKVAEVHKRGFSWRDKVFRREEVTVYRYEPPKAELEDATDEHTLNEEGVETDE